VAQQEYEQSQAIDASPEEVFAWLSDVGNLPKYLPPVVDSSVEGPSAEGVPGRRIRTTLEYPGEGGGMFDAVGYLGVDERERRMEWGAEGGRDYSGWLTVANRGEGEARWWCTSTSESAPRGLILRKDHPRAAIPWRRAFRRLWRASAGSWRKVRARWRPRHPRREQSLS